MLPNRFLADASSDRNHALRDFQGGSLAVSGTMFELWSLFLMKSTLNSPTDGAPTTTRTPFLKVVGGRYVGRRPMWGNRLPYRSTLIRPQNSVSPEWLVVELSQKFMDKADPFW